MNDSGTFHLPVHTPGTLSLYAKDQSLSMKCFEELHYKGFTLSPFPGPFPLLIVLDNVSI